MSALDRYLDAARAEALVLLDAGGPYGRLIAREDVPALAILTICRHQTETVAMVVRCVRATPMDHSAGTPAQLQQMAVPRVVADAKYDAADYVRRCGYDPEQVHAVAGERATGRRVTDPLRPVFLAWFVAEAAYFDATGRVLAVRAHITPAEAIGVLQRYETLAAASAASIIALSSGGEWPPSPSDVRTATAGAMPRLSTTFHSAYGSWVHSEGLDLQ